MASESQKSTSGKILPLAEEIRQLYDEFGQRKPMGMAASDIHRPHYFLHRTFLDMQDLLIIFNTKRCRYQCHFCELPLKSSTSRISDDDILAQFKYVLYELKHSLSVLDQLTLSNEGSVLDSDTFPTETLLTIGACSHELRRVQRLVLETRLEFVTQDVIHQLKDMNPRATIDILTGFETVDTDIRDELLFKRETIDDFLVGLDKVAISGTSLTAYVLFKPSPVMTDEEAFFEAENSIDFLSDQCSQRHIPLTIRLNPMYAARHSKWAQLARVTPIYAPPRLTDVLKLSEKKAQEGIRIYIGLSIEGLADPWGTYKSREDFSPTLLKKALLFNSCNRTKLEDVDR